MIVAPDFQHLLRDFSPTVLDSAAQTIYGLRPDLTLAYLNSGWTTFAAHNGGRPPDSTTWTLGRCVLDALPRDLVQFFSQNFGRCLREDCPWEHRYECSSADRFRMYIMTTYPLGNAEGLLVVNSLVQETAHTRTPCQPLEDLYRDEHGFINQCCHCRRVQRGTQHTWDWIPDWVKTYPSGTSHVLCEPCFGFYYSNPKFHKIPFPDTFRTRST